jgi:hypothetical protein
MLMNFKTVRSQRGASCSLHHGVARIVIHDGYESLSPTQRTHYDAVVTPALRKRAEEIEGKRLGVAAS